MLGMHNILVPSEGHPSMEIQPYSLSWRVDPRGQLGMLRLGRVTVLCIGRLPGARRALILEHAATPFPAGGDLLVATSIRRSKAEYEGCAVTAITVLISVLARMMLRITCCCKGYLDGMCSCCLPAMLLYSYAG